MNDMRSRENRIHSSDTKPFSYYNCVIPTHFNCAPMHWHSEFEINYIREGSAEFICGDEKFISKTGDIVITQPNVLHSIYPVEEIKQAASRSQPPTSWVPPVTGESQPIQCSLRSQAASRSQPPTSWVPPVTYDTLVFSAEIFGSSGADRCTNECIRPLVDGSMKVRVHITPEHRQYSELRDITEIIFDCAKEDSPRHDMLLRSEILRLFWLLEAEADIYTEAEDTNEIIRPALEYIAGHYQEEITIKQLADTVHLSPSYFMNQFQKHVGFSAALYISHFRINKACLALIDTKKNISEIAFDCGFRNLSNFNRQFLRIVGCSPSLYRKKGYTSTF